jgi:hypothetical protein
MADMRNSQKKWKAARCKLRQPGDNAVPMQVGGADSPS